jgi:hypothetical protein
MRMGRRSRARERAATEARPEPAVAAARPRRRLLGLLNPFRFRRLTRSRARYAAVGFGLSGLVFAAAGWLTGEVAWFSSAVLLGVLAAVWWVSSMLLGGDDPSS